MKVRIYQVLTRSLVALFRHLVSPDDNTSSGQAAKTALKLHKLRNTVSVW